MAEFQLNVKINGVDQSVRTIGDVEQALKATREELKGLEVGSEAFEELARQARILQNELKESFKEATNFDKSLGQLTQSVARLGSSVAAGFTIATTALSVFGKESEEITQAQIKAQQALAVAFAATTIATNAAKLSGDLKLVSDRLQLGVTNLLTAAVGQETIAKSRLAVSTGTATIAQRALNAAMSVNPVLLLVGAIATLTGAYLLLSKRQEESLTILETYNSELERSSVIAESEIKLIKERIKLQRELDLLNVTSAEEKAKIEKKFNEELIELDKQSLENQKSVLESKLNNVKLNASDIEGVLKEQYINEVINLNNQKNILFKNETEYINALINLREKYFKTSDETAKADFEKRNKEALDLAIKLDETAGQLELIESRLELNVKKTDKEITDSRKAELQKRLKAQADFEEAIKRLNDDRFNRELKLERELEDLQLESAKKRTRNYIDILDIEINQIKIRRDRELEDEKKRFDDSIEAFKKTQIEKGISIKEINSVIKKLQEDFDSEQITRQQVFSNKIIEIEQERADTILLIDEILQSELAFGDFSTADRRLKLLADEAAARLQFNTLQIQSERGFLFKLLEERKVLIQEALKAEKLARIEAIKEDFNESLRNLQGTQEQINKQRTDLQRQLNKDLELINEEYRLKQAAADRQSIDELRDYIAGKIQEIAQITNQVLTIGIQLGQALSDIARTERENELNELRDYLAQRESLVNNSFNSELESLQNLYTQGIISQEAYNQKSTELEDSRTNSISALQDELAQKELSVRKKAFEDEKKLKIAQTITSGINGALTAFATAFQLGPIAGPIVGGILSSLVAATTGVQVAAIKKTKFDSGPPNITPPKSVNISGQIGGSEQFVPSGGGFTGFSEDLVGSPSTGESGQDGGRPAPTRVYVLESDITDTQNRVSVAEGLATIG
jgi:hypothetical protein